MAELRVYVRGGPTRFRPATNKPIPAIDVHVLVDRTCADGFWCPRCHPPIDQRVFHLPESYSSRPLGGPQEARSLHATGTAIDYNVTVPRNPFGR